MKIKYLLPIFLILVFILTFETELIAGPGGKIARNLFSSFWGKLFLGMLTIILLPIIIPMMIRDYFKIKKTKKILNQLAMKDDNFELLKLNSQVKGIFNQVHRAWKKEEMELASEFMTDWYWQNQQLVFLNDWEEQGLENICRVREINSLKPIHIKATNNPNFEGSRVTFLIDADMEDYLKKRDSDQIVEGKKGFNDVETIWTFVLNDGKWLVENIEQGEMLSAFIKMPNSVPEVATA